MYIITTIDKIPYEKPDVNKGMQEYRINYQKEKNEKCNCFAEIFLRNEYYQNKNSVPVYIRRFSENVFDKKIWLPKNNYYLIVREANDRILFKNELQKFPLN